MEPILKVSLHIRFFDNLGSCLQTYLEYPVSPGIAISINHIPFIRVQDGPGDIFIGFNRVNDRISHTFNRFPRFGDKIPNSRHKVFNYMSCFFPSCRLLGYIGVHKDLIYFFKNKKLIEPTYLGFINFFPEF